MPRQYRVTFENVAISGATNDLFQIVGAAGKLVRVKRFHWGATDTTLPTAQMVQTRVRFLPATVTNGSGGTTPTPQKIDPGDAAASFTSLANNTTKATTSGTAVVLAESGDHIYSGYDKTWKDEDMPTIGAATESLVLEILSTVSGTVHISGEAECLEYGG